MKLLSHFPAVGLSNTYVVGNRNGGDALLVDPGRFDVSLLELIESAGFDITAVLVTHNHGNHVQGLRTLLKVYRAEIFAGNESVMGFPSRSVSDGEIIRAAGFDVEVMNVEGHTADSRVYRVGPYLFTGDVLSAGRVGSTSSIHSRAVILRSIREKLLPLDETFIVLPGHGPPTTIGTEKRWNPDLRN